MKGIALVALSLAVLHAPLAGAQAAQPAAPNAKSPVTARILGIIPGVGHMYAGEPGRGIAYMAGTVGLLAVASGVALGCVADTPAEGDCPTSRAIDVLSVATVGLWAWSIYDAGRAAKRTNRRRALQHTAFMIAPGRSVARGTRGRRGALVGLHLGL